MHALLFAFLVCTRECCSFWFLVFLLSKWFFNRLWGWTKNNKMLTPLILLFFFTWFITWIYCVVRQEWVWKKKWSLYCILSVWCMNKRGLILYFSWVCFFFFSSSFLCSPFCSDTRHWWYLWYLLLLTMSFHYIRIFCFDLYTVAILAHMKSTTICSQLKSEKYLFC